MRAETWHEHIEHIGLPAGGGGGLEWVRDLNLGGEPFDEIEEYDVAPLRPKLRYSAVWEEGIALELLPYVGLLTQLDEELALVKKLDVPPPARTKRTGQKRKRHQHRRGHCPGCGRETALTHAGKPWRHVCPGKLWDQIEQPEDQHEPEEVLLAQARSERPWHYPNRWAQVCRRCRTAVHVGQGLFRLDLEGEWEAQHLLPGDCPGTP